MPSRSPDSASSTWRFVIEPSGETGVRADAVGDASAGRGVRGMELLVVVNNDQLYVDDGHVSTKCGSVDLRAARASGSVMQSQRPPVIAVLRNAYSDRRFISCERPAQDSKF
jgi:hypothetical protein